MNWFARQEDTAKERPRHDALVGAESAQVAQIKRAVFRSLTWLRAATLKVFDTIARLETQAIDACNGAHSDWAKLLIRFHEDEALVDASSRAAAGGCRVATLRN